MGKKKEKEKRNRKAGKKKIRTEELSKEMFSTGIVSEEKASKKKSSKEKISKEKISKEKTSEETSSKEKALKEKALKEKASTAKTSEEKISKEKTSGEKPSEEREMSAVFQALSDENRLKILSLLSEREMCSSELLKSVAVVQSTMSHHMKVLSESGLVDCRRDGKRICYTIRQDTLDCLESYIREWRNADILSGKDADTDEQI